MNELITIRKVATQYLASEHRDGERPVGMRGGKYQISN